MELTRVDKFDDVWVKREDMPGFVSLDYPSGSKVRQYNQMAAAAPGAPMIVGCASHSAMQIYVAAAAKQANVQAVIYVPARKVRTSATEYAAGLGAEINEVRPGYMNVVRSRARARAKEIGRVVRWDVNAALMDAYEQTQNIPEEVQRVVVATGSGLTAAGVLAGLSTHHARPEVVVIATSGLASEEKIIGLATKAWEKGHGLSLGKFNKPWFPKLTLIRHPLKYEEDILKELPDGTPLDPYYAAKAWDYLKPGDCLWTPGLRCVASMPRGYSNAFKNWKGFNVLP